MRHSCFLALSAPFFWKCASRAVPLASKQEPVQLLSSVPRSVAQGHSRVLARLHLRSQQPVTFQLSLSATGPCSLGTLGLRRASKTFLRTFPIRRCCGSQPNVSGTDPLAKLTTLKLRLERFRTSHARVEVNLLFWLTGASEMRTDFVGFLFKTSTCCGDAWKNCGMPVLCTYDGAGIT